MADFANLFGIRPWEWDLLTLADFNALAGAVDGYRAKLEAAARG
jgi:hypothetical protein